VANPIPEIKPIKNEDEYHETRRELMLYQRRAGDVLALVSSAVTVDDWDFVTHMSSELISAVSRISGLSRRLDRAQV
jgi:hypothetical protein